VAYSELLRGSTRSDNLGLCCGLPAVAEEALGDPFSPALPGALWAGGCCFICGCAATCCVLATAAAPVAAAGADTADSLPRLLGCGCLPASACAPLPPALGVPAALLPPLLLTAELPRRSSSAALPLAKSSKDSPLCWTPRGVPRGVLKLLLVMLKVRSSSPAAASVSKSSWGGWPSLSSSSDSMCCDSESWVLWSMRPSDTSVLSLQDNNSSPVDHSVCQTFHRSLQNVTGTWYKGVSGVCPWNCPNYLQYERLEVQQHQNWQQHGLDASAGNDAGVRACT
jgi:hypothetical protein